MSRTLEEVKEMHDAYFQGQSLRDIGREHGLSYERVRQLFYEHDMMPRAARIDSVRRYEGMIEAWERQDEILDAYKKFGSVTATAEHTGLRRGQVATVLERFKQRSTYRKRGGSRKGKWRYSDDQIFGFMREAAAQQGEPLTVSAYNQYAKGKGAPTNLTIMNRFGSWKAACEAAGVKANDSRNHRPKVLSEQDCINAIHEYAIEHYGVVPSYLRYSEWAKSNGKPSGPTVRKRFGSWLEAVHKAFPEESKQLD